jgi:hypothetical protein
MQRIIFMFSTQIKYLTCIYQLFSFPPYNYYINSPLQKRPNTQSGKEQEHREFILLITPKMLLSFLVRHHAMTIVLCQDISALCQK